MDRQLYLHTLSLQEKQYSHWISSGVCSVYGGEYYELCLAKKKLGFLILVGFFSHERSGGRWGLGSDM